MEKLIPSLVNECESRTPETKDQPISFRAKKMNQGKFYYELTHGVYYLMLLDGEFQEFTTYQEMVLFVEDPHAEFIKVTPENWHRLYEEGVFHQ